MTLFGAYARDGQPAWSGGLVTLLSQLGFSAGAARMALNRVVDRGLLERQRDGRLISYMPTPRLLELIEVGDRRLEMLRRPPAWDGTWTLVWYSIPDELRRERHRLGRRLRFLGFGPLEDSTWVGPRDQREEVVPFLERLGLQDLAGVFVGQHAVEPDAIVARAWLCDELVLRYELFVSEFGPLAGASLDGEAAFRAHAMMTNTFRRFPYLDPGLPQSLFPAADPRRAAAKLYHEVSQRLVAAARRHFDAATKRLD